MSSVPKLLGYKSTGDFGAIKNMGRRASEARSFVRVEGAPLEPYDSKHSGLHAQTRGGTLRTTKQQWRLYNQAKKLARKQALRNKSKDGNSLVTK